MKERLIHFSVLLLAVVAAHFIAYKLVHIPRQLEVVIILGALLFYPIMRRPIIGIYAVFIISPFIPYIRRLYYLAHSRPAMDPLIVIGDMLLVFILMGLFFELREHKQERNYTQTIGKIVFIYFIYLVLRTFFFNYLPLTIAVAKFKYYGPPVLFFFIGILYADQINSMKRLWYLTITISIIAALYGFNQLYRGYSAAEQIWFTEIEFTTLFIEKIPRPFSIFQAPVVLADYSQLGLIGIMMCFTWFKGKPNFLLYSMIPVLLYASLITSVRSSWIGIVAMFIIWPIFFRIKGNWNRLAVLAGFLLFYIGYTYVAESFDAGLKLEAGITALTSPFSKQQQFNLLVADRTSALYNPLEEHSFLSRLILWQNLLAYSREPILAFLGRGLGALNADSLYFTYLAEFGYPGMIFIAWIILVFIVKGLYIIDSSRDDNIVGLIKGITIMNIVFAIVSITGTHIHYFPGDLYFWFWNGVLVQLAAIYKAQQPQVTVSESGVL